MMEYPYRVARRGVCSFLSNRIFWNFLSSVIYFLMSNHSQDSPHFHIHLVWLCLCAHFCLRQPTSPCVHAGPSSGWLSSAQLLDLQPLVLCFSLWGGSAGSFRAPSTVCCLFSI